MKKFIILSAILTFYISCISNQQENQPIHIYFIGESNSGGSADNSDALSSELDVNSDIQIWDNINNDGFEDLKISNPNSNNLLGHAGKESQVGIRHGWELQLQNRASEFNTPIYLTKCGQGGSVISEWDTADPYYQSFLTRSNGSINELSTLGVSNIQTFVFISFGINDGIADTDPSAWYTATLDWLQRVKNQTGAIHMFITEIPDNGPAHVAIDNEITNLANNLSYLTKIQTSDAPLRTGDMYHWNYSGMKLICDRMVDEMKTYL